MRALVTGSNGFVGTHLINHLLAQRGLEVIGVDLKVRADAPFTSLVADLTNADQMAALAAEVRPDFVFHLAAQAAVQVSWSDRGQTVVNNLLAQMYLCDALLSAGLRPRVLVIGSSDEYGLVRPEELPVREDNPLRPNSPYAVSKIGQDMLAYQYFASHALPTVRVRPFNHLGPGQSDLFVAASFAKQIAEIEAGMREPVLLVGNLTAKRDFTDVRDVVRAYSLLAQQGTPGEVYNLGSGRSLAISELLAQLLGRSTVRIEVRTDPARLRPSDIPDLYCDYGKAEREIGWRPLIPLASTLDDVLDYWRTRIGVGGN
ncbi:MAG: GDP-mannose 4,6-dehydratase [Chloroflexota bacterium]